MSDPLLKLYHWEKETPGNLLFHQPLSGSVRTFTFSQAGNEIRRIASALKAMGLPHGSRVAILSKNCAHWVMADLAIWMAGYVSVPIYPTLTAPSIRQILEHSESAAIFLGKLDDYSSQKDGVPSHLKKISFPDYGPGDGINWNDLLKHEPVTGTPTLQPEELATIVYTSGTTGVPKGAMINFRAFDYALDVPSKTLFTPPERFFSYLPLSHIAERMLVEMGAIYSGSTIYFSESLEKFPQNLADAQPTIFLAVPRIWTKFREKILESLPQKKLDLLLSIPIINNVIRNKIKKKLGLSKARWILTGASPISVEMLAWYKKLDINIHDVYGMTENLCYAFINLEKIRFGTVGQAWTNAETRISEDGEIQTRHLATMMGYYKDEATTKSIFTSDGFLKTGDTGVIDKEGFLTITGRIKDQFKTDKGKFIAPSPIEIRLQSSTDIEFVCVVGMGVPQPLALVVLSAAGKAKAKPELMNDFEQLLVNVNEELESFERLHAVVILRDMWTVENGLVTPSLKVKRNEIEKIHLPTYPTWYHSGQKVVWQ